MMLTMILVGELLAATPVAVPAQGGLRIEPRESVDGKPLTGPEALQRLTPVEQLTNPRTGVTCTMQILRARPADPQSVMPAVPSAVDPGIRGHVSPCLD
jgi:hypothetical protein